MVASPIYFPFQDWIVRRRPFWLEDSRPTIDGEKVQTWLRAGKIRVRAPIETLRENEVILEDGSAKSCGLVIYAIGFRPALKHLWNLSLQLNEAELPDTENFESTQYAGLYFLALDRLRTFRRHYLRGIREGTILLAEAIALKIKNRS